MTTGWLRRHRKVLAWTSGALALVLVGLVVTGYTVLRHFNDNIQQVNLTGLIGPQPANLHPQAENVLIMGSDTKLGQSRTTMVIHIAANRKRGEVMSIPFNSWVKIPSCKMPDGRLSAPTKGMINKAFAIGDRDRNHVGLGAACMIKTVEQNTGIYIDHFIVVNLAGFKSMVAALSGVKVCLPTAFRDPSAGVFLPAGCHLLTPTQALAYVRAMNGFGYSGSLQRIGRQEQFMSDLISRAKSELYNPLAIYRFFDAFTKSLTIDSRLGGVTGLYHLYEELHGIPSSKINFFTLVTYPRARVVPSDKVNVLWKQPQDSEIFASFQDDTPTSPQLYGASAPAK